MQISRMSILKGEAQGIPTILPKYSLLNRKGKKGWKERGLRRKWGLSSLKKIW